MCSRATNFAIQSIWFCTTYKHYRTPLVRVSRVFCSLGVLCRIKRPAHQRARNVWEFSNHFNRARLPVCHIMLRSKFQRCSPYPFSTTLHKCHFLFSLPLPCFSRARVQARATVGVRASTALCPSTSLDYLSAIRFAAAYLPSEVRQDITSTQGGVARGVR